MFSYSGHNSIRRFLTITLVVLALLLQPFYLALAESDIPPADPPQEEQIQDPAPEATQTEGTDGTDGKDATSGTDGTSPNDPSGNPQEGEGGGGTEGGTNGQTEDSAGSTEPAGDGETTIDTGDATSEGTIENTIDVNELKVKLDEMYSKYNLPLGYIIYNPETGKYEAYTPEAQKKLDEKKVSIENEINRLKETYREVLDFIKEKKNKEDALIHKFNVQKQKIASRRNSSRDRERLLFEKMTEKNAIVAKQEALVHRTAQSNREKGVFETHLYSS